MELGLKQFGYKRFRLKTNANKRVSEILCPGSAKEIEQYWVRSNFALARICAVSVWLRLIRITKS